VDEDLDIAQIKKIRRIIKWKSSSAKVVSNKACLYRSHLSTCWNGSWRGRGENGKVVRG
jgi:hypothetical protein